MGLIIKIETSDVAVRATDVLVKVTLTNDGGESLRFRRHDLGPGLALEVRDAADKPVHLPPPAPDREESTPFQIDARGDRVLDYISFLDMRMPAGVYSVRFVARPFTKSGVGLDVVRSKSVEFKVKDVPLPPLTIYVPWWRRLWWWWCRCTCVRQHVSDHEESFVPPPDPLATLPEPAPTCYEWQSRFKLTIDRKLCVAMVDVNIYYKFENFLGGPPADWAFKTKRNIQCHWGGRYKLTSTSARCPGGYQIYFRVNLREYEGDTLPDPLWPHYDIKVAAAGSTGFWLDKWSVNNVWIGVHEFGHMLGNCDEYGKVSCGTCVEDMSAFTSDAVGSDDSVMNHGPGAPQEEHYAQIVAAAQSCLPGTQLEPVDEAPLLLPVPGPT